MGQVGRMPSSARRPLGRFAARVDVGIDPYSISSIISNAACRFVNDVLHIVKSK